MSTFQQTGLVAAGIVITVLAAYYFFTQDAALVLRSSEADQELATLLQSAQVFTERRAALDAIALDMTALNNPSFTTLRDLSAEPQEFQVGRINPFLPGVSR